MLLKFIQDSVETAENLLKRHSDFEAKLRAQEDRLKAFARNADQLIQAKHSEADFIKKVFAKHKMIISCTKLVW